MSITVPMYGFGGGGGAPLNFEVVGNPQPDNSKENTLWVNTDVKITSWIFSATEPENPAEGMVWFSVGTSSPVEFNALKKNALQVYPRSAQQYVSGAWVDVTAKIYQNSVWASLDNRFFLFKEGVGLGDGVAVDSPNWNMGLTVNTNVMNVSKSKGDTSRVFFKPKFDLTNFKTLHMELRCGDRYSDSFYMFFGVGNDQPTNSGNGAFDAQTDGIYTVTREFYSLDISAITGEKYIKIICPAVITNLYNAWLE